MRLLLQSVRGLGRRALHYQRQLEVQTGKSSTWSTASFSTLRQARPLTSLWMTSVRHMTSSHEDYVIRSQLDDIIIPEDTSLGDFVISGARRQGDKIAMVDDASGRAITSLELAELVARLAGALADRGLRKGDVLCIHSANSVDMALLVLATIYAGGAVTPANPACTPEELLYQLEDSQPKFLAVGPGQEEVAKAALQSYTGIKAQFSFATAEGFEPFSALMENGAPVSPAAVDPSEDIALVPYSSGTTGRPKGVMLTHRNMIANLLQFHNPATTTDVLRERQEVYLLLLPLFHIYGLFMVLHSARRGVKLVFLPSFNPPHYIASIDKYKASVLHIVPPIAVVLSQLSGAAEGHDLTSVNTALCAAAPLDSQLAQALMASLGIPAVKQGYGMTELSPVVTFAPNEGWKHGSVGVLLPSTEALVVDPETGRPCRQRQHGEIWIRGPQVMKGYLGNPEATAQTVDSDGWLHTGDIGYFDEDQHFFISDRLKELIKYKGFQVPPAELEALLLTHPALADAAVVGAPDELAGEVPRAFVVLKPGERLTEEDLQNFVRGRKAPHYQLRGGVGFLAAIPKSPAGKILRRLLRDM